MIIEIKFHWEPNHYSVKIMLLPTHKIIQVLSVQVKESKSLE